MWNGGGGWGVGVEPRVSSCAWYILYSFGNHSTYCILKKVEKQQNKEINNNDKKIRNAMPTETYAPKEIPNLKYNLSEERKKRKLAQITSKITTLSLYIPS